jgi:RNA polymerase sigma-70 factor (ECF subfamily)
MATWYQKMHARLLADDVTAPAELAETMLDPLIAKLAKKYPGLHASELLVDAVTDALMNYIKNPAQFDPSKLSLPGFLKMAADRDLRNALAKLGRLRGREIFLEDVELVQEAGNNEVEADHRESRVLGQKIKNGLSKIFTDPKDLKLMELIFSGERETAVFAEILGIGNLPTETQRREVKRHKDRIKKRLERYGKSVDAIR